MSNDIRPDSDGEDAFAGAVGDQLPGRQDAPYQGRHARPGEADHLEDPQSGVPGSWPGAEGGVTPSGPPTSPATGQASANAARAAYADAAKSTPTHPPAPEPSRPEEDPMHDPAAPAAPAPEAAERAPEATAAGEHPDTQLAAERLADLQRLQAEYVNYKRRVDRDRHVERDRAVASVIESMLPVLDEIQLARQHGELETGPFAKIAEKLEGILGKQGLERFGQPGDAFDPTVHEAVMHVQAELAPGTTGTTVVQVMQPGYTLGERVVRPALVAVADPA